MEIMTKCENRCLTFFLKGELDHHGARGLIARLEREIEIHLPWKMVLDFSEVTFMDSSGIAVVVQTARALARCGGTLSVVNTPPQAKKVLTCAGIHRMVDIR